MKAHVGPDGVNRDHAGHKAYLLQCADRWAHGMCGPPNEAQAAVVRKMAERLDVACGVCAREKLPHKLYDVRYVHKISSSDADRVERMLPDGVIADRKTLGKALRDADVLGKGDRIRDFRVEGDRVVVFPQAMIWHSIILTPVDDKTLK